MLKSLNLETWVPIGSVGRLCFDADAFAVALIGS
jgi:hypothetical protein